MRTTLIAVFTLCLAAAASADVYVVNNGNDAGPGSLRQAILDANAHAGLDSIDFSVSGTGQRRTILVQSPLVVTSPLVIDGSTQVTGVAQPVIIDRLGGNGDGFVFQSGADASEVRNLEIRGVSTADNAAIHLSGASAVKITGNVIGSAGSLSSRNRTGVRVRTNDNVIGGLLTSERNIIGGNDIGITLESGAAGNTIQGNYFGVDAAVTEKRVNASAAISIQNGHDNLIGGGAGARNVFVGSPVAVLIFKPSADNRIEGNYIGIGPNGEAQPDFANTQGIVLGGIARNSAIGNVISNNAIGIVVPEGLRHKIQGNRIGVDPAFTHAVPNGNGIVVLNVSDVDNLLIGGVLASEGNVICGNTENGVSVDATGVVNIEGNRIGIDDTGEKSIPNGTGVRVQGSENTIVGGPVPASGNIISGNRGDGIFATRATIFSNVIGLGPDRSTVVPNGGNGITAVTDGELTIGAVGTGNIIVANNGFGIDIAGTGASAARSIEYNTIRGNARGGIRLRDNDRHTIRFNSITRNTGLGIDLGGDGVTLNDALDGDNGPNRLQNYPVLTHFILTGSQLTVLGTLNSTPRTTFTLDFYLDLEPEASGFGEGGLYLATATTTTDAGGNAAFSINLPAAGTALNNITATATDPAGNTSEFSRRLFIGPGAPGKQRSVRH
jgi:parallel beta-helix repeat protein